MHSSVILASVGVALVGIILAITEAKTGDGQVIPMLIACRSGVVWSTYIFFACFSSSLSHKVSLSIGRPYRRFLENSVGLLVLGLVILLYGFTDLVYLLSGW
jgi:hypothetical protein